MPGVSLYKVKSPIHYKHKVFMCKIIVSCLTYQMQKGHWMKNLLGSKRIRPQ